MDYHPVADFDVVATRELHLLKGFEVLSAAAENPLGQESAERDPQLDVLSQSRAIEHLPQPLERLDLRILVEVDLAVVLGLQCHIPRIQLIEGDLGGQ